MYSTYFNQPAFRGGGSTPVTGDPISFTVRDSTPFDVINSQSGGGGVNIGPDGNGWVGEIVFKGLATGGTFDATKVIIAVSDPGYDTGSNVVTRTRTIVGGKVLRQQRPNQANSAIYTSGSDVLVQFSLSDRIYQMTTITGISVAAGAYTGSNAKSTGITLTNSSTRSYYKPLYAHISQPYERAIGSTYSVEGVAMHCYPLNGQMVAAIAFTATDGTNTTTPVVAGSTSLSSLITQGHPPDVFKADIPLSALTQGATCTVLAKVYPWIGDSSAVLDLAVTGTAFPTSVAQSKLPFVCDKTGGYGGAIACVLVGAVGGTVQTSITSARLTPYPTISAALTALAAYNNTNKGHNDIGGVTIYLMDALGSAVTHNLTSNAAATGAAWCDIKADPINTGAITVTATATALMPARIRYSSGVNLVGTAATSFFIATNDGPAGDVGFDGCSLDTTGVTQPVSSARRQWWRNLTLVNVPVADMFSRVETAQNYGTVAAGTFNITSNRNFSGRLMIGCHAPQMGVFQATAPGAANDSNDGVIIYNNYVRQNSVDLAGNQTYSKGFAIVQFLSIWDGGGTTAPYNGSTGGGPTAYTFSADSTTNSIDNFIEIYCTYVGERGNNLYNDVDATCIAPSGLIKRGTAKYNLYNNWANKSDCSNTTTLRGNVGPWEWAWNVANEGNVSFYGSKGGGSPNPGTGLHYLGEYWPPSSNAAAYLTAIPAFVNDPASSAAGGNQSGDYHLTGPTNTAYTRVAAGFSALGHDIGGAVRLNDGTGACGAYER